MTMTKNPPTSRTIPLLLAAFLISLPAQAQYGGGTGKPNDPWLIYTPAQMNAIGADPNHWDKHFKLMADIDLVRYANTGLHRIGSEARPFCGWFDGNGHTISQYVNRTSDSNQVGLFAYVGLRNCGGWGTEIKNLGLLGPIVCGKAAGNAGALVGFLVNAKITNCCVEGGLVVGGENTGGLVGRNCGTITGCYASVPVIGDGSAGGLVGDTELGSIVNCYSTGIVLGGDKTGGLVGLSGADKVTGSFWDTETSGQNTSAGGEAKTTAELQTAATFFDWSTCDGEGIWTLDAGRDYPRLWWERKAGEPLKSGPLSGFLEGCGTGDDPYLIYSAEELNLVGAFPCAWGEQFRLMADIDLAEYSGTTFHIVGTRSLPFAGVFDGNGHVITNFSYTGTDQNCLGLFRCVSGPNAAVMNLGLIDPRMNAGTGTQVGSLVGCLWRGVIMNCYALNASVSAGDDTGGLVGWDEYGEISNSYTTGIVSGRGCTGGLVGYDYCGLVTGCYSCSDVVGHDDVGGLAGYHNNSSIRNCYATGTIRGYFRVGGLLGSDHWNGTVRTCYAIGAVAGSGYTGGLVGYSKGDVVSSFWDIETSGQSTSAGGEGRTTAQMQTVATFLSWGICDSEGVWVLAEGRDYPRLWWENKPGELLRSPPLSDLLEGNGTSDAPYLIYTAEQLNLIGAFPCAWDEQFRLMADIDLSAYPGTTFRVIGAPTLPFTGVFDGNKHVIANLRYTGTNKSYNGLFRCISDPNAVVKNLGMVNARVDGGSGKEAGGLVGSLAGYLEEGTITECYARGGSVSGSSRAGGLVGTSAGNIRNSFSSTSVAADADYAGGLVGFSGGMVANCYATGGTTAKWYVGGLVGWNCGRIENSYSSGAVLGSITGGLVGDRYGDVVINSFWDIKTSGRAFSAGGTGKTTTEMQTASTFLEAGWDFVGETANGTEDIWWIDEGKDYPHLWWEAAAIDDR